MITNSGEVFERVRDSRDTLCKKSDLKVLMKTMVRFFASFIFFGSEFYKLLYLISEKTRLLDTQRGLIGTNLPSNFQLNLAMDRLKNIRIFIEDRRKATGYYYDKLKMIGSGDFRLQVFTDTLSHFPIMINESVRNDFVEFMVRHNLQVSVLYKKTISHAYGTGESQKYLNAETYCREVALLPLYFNIGASVQHLIVNTIRKWCMMREQDRVSKGQRQ